MESHTNGNGRRIKEWTIGGVAVTAILSMGSLAWQKVEDNTRQLQAIDGQVKGLAIKLQSLQKRVDRLGGMM